MSTSSAIWLIRAGWNSLQPCAFGGQLVLLLFRQMAEFALEGQVQRVAAASRSRGASESADHAIAQRVSHRIRPAHVTLDLPSSFT
jgi:hypothetical protein